MGSSDEDGVRLQGDCSTQKRDLYSSDCFSGDEATVVPVLTALGYSIIHIGEDWTEDEVVATNVDYFEMLCTESQWGLQQVRI